MLTEYLRETWALYLEMAPYLLLGFTLAGVLHAMVPRKAVGKHLGGENLISSFKAAVLGVPMPLCSCGVIPTGVGLRKRGASRAATVSFLISTPQTGVDSILVTYGFFGWALAIFRPIAAFISGVLGGLAVMLVKPGTREEEWMKHHLHSEDALAEADERKTTSEKFRDAYHFAFKELLGDIALWLVVGILIAGVISTAVPDDFFAEKLGGGIGAMLLMMLFGLPLYVCSTASVPIAAVLMTKGISAGAAFVFLMVGPATNAATMLVIARALGSKVLAVYLAAIAGFALLFGLGLDFLLTHTPLSVNLPEHLHQHGVVWWQLASAAVLSYFVLRHFYFKLRRRYGAAPLAMSDKLQLSIEGMNCSHCVKNVKDSLEKVPGVNGVDVSLDNGTAVVDGEKLDRATLAAAVEGAGYRVKG
ncbi:MAG: SO_0444 family Cu/Zn efflux transporter [Calditrichaeota bacterium]|nr:SO_0444 family Cu/Zn efflux transporter [Calditrichota bacterium]